MSDPRAVTGRPAWPALGLGLGVAALALGGLAGPAPSHTPDSGGDTTAVAAIDSAAAGPRIYLAWRAPYGHPRATDAVPDACTRPGTDTLYLTYRTGRTSRFYVGFEGTLYFRAPAGDTLGPHWRLDQNPEHAVMEYEGNWGAARPWRAGAYSGAHFDRTPGTGRLRFFNIRPIGDPVPIRDSVDYQAARILVERPAAGSPRCNQPICIEWASADLLLDSTRVTRSGPIGRRFVSWNSASGAACERPATAGPQPWKPPVRK